MVTLQTTMNDSTMQMRISSADAAQESHQSTFYSAKSRKEEHHDHQDLRVDTLPPGNPQGRNQACCLASRDPFL